MIDGHRDTNDTRAPARTCTPAAVDPGAYPGARGPVPGVLAPAGGRPSPAVTARGDPAAVAAEIASLTAFAAHSPSAMALARLRTSLRDRPSRSTTLCARSMADSRATIAAVRGSGSAPWTSVRARIDGPSPRATSRRRANGSAGRLRAPCRDAARGCRAAPASRRARPSGPCRAGRPGPERCAPSGRPPRLPSEDLVRRHHVRVARTFGRAPHARLLLDVDRPESWPARSARRHRARSRRTTCRRPRRTRRRAAAGARLPQSTSPWLDVSPPCPPARKAVASAS